MIGKVNSLRELFEIKLRYAYDCEQKLVEKGLPSMIENAGSQELGAALQHHLQETRNHLVRLEHIFSTLGKEPDTKGNDIFDELASAAKDSVSNIDDSPLRDAALIANGNRWNTMKSRCTAHSLPSRATWDCATLSARWNDPEGREGGGCQVDADWRNLAEPTSGQVPHGRSVVADSRRHSRF